ncbi:MAG: methyltransferase domain-containing protein [Alphaproteobacteria bacterium]|nr:methyltransferase domain-containing protein [Alphaproteobacteria bacterium]
MEPAAADAADEAQLYYLAEEHRSAGRLADAEAAYRTLLAQKPRHLSALESLEALLVEQNRTDEAANIRRKRTKVEARNAYAIGKALCNESEYERAVPFFERAIELRPDYRKAQWRLGETFGHLNRKEEALRCYRRYRELDPESVEAAFVIAALGEGEVPTRPPEVYVQGYFDGYAESFDEHLCKGLNYRGPEILFEYVRRVLDRTAGPLDVLDIGCGTGLAGLKFRELAKTLAGVDLSEKMLAQAEARGLYDALHRGDAVTFLEEAPEASCDLLIACDSLVYFGDLESLVAAAFRALRPGGFFAFTLEKGTGAGFTLQASGRYAHHPGYVPALATGRFCLREVGEETVRLEFGKPVIELIYALEKPLK